MTSFDERERAFENLFVHDADVRFRVLARRNKGLAAWASQKMGKSGDVASAYNDAILGFALSNPDDAALTQRIVDDLNGAGHPVTLADVQAELQQQTAAALAREKMP